MKDSVTRMNDLLPKADELFQSAYGALVGDPAFISWGIHQGRNVRRVDMMGLTKDIVYDAAIRGDMVFFQRLHQVLTANPWQFPPSLRTLIPKDEIDASKGTRPIDDPCELKRLVALCVRHEIEVLAERFMHPGQFGGRPARSIKPACLRRGATMQDHVATSIWQGIREGYGHVLVLDLKDAFGLLPERAALAVLQDIGLDDEAARWVWRLCRIDAVDSRNKHIHYARQERGIEQGNVISATMMNLALAPIITRLESRLDVQVFAYLDDIYVLTRTDETAREAFNRFRQSARDHGFTNVRRLKKDTDPADSKNSMIITVDVQPVTVLKTYQVDALGISLHPDKVLKLRGEGKFVGKVSISALRKVSDCRCLTKGACRSRNSDAIRPAPSKPVNHHSTVIAPADVVEWFSSLPSVNIGTEAQDQSVITTVSPVNVITEDPTGMSENLGNPELHDSGLMVNQGGADTSVSVTPSPHGERIMSSQCHGADGIPGNRDSCRPQGVTSLDRRRGVARERPAHLSVHWSEIQPNLLTPGRLDVGNKFKGCVLDLTNISAAIGNAGGAAGGAAAGAIVQGVNRLIRLVRTDSRAEVRIDPKEPWTAIQTVLGNSLDTVYTRTSYKYQSDGTAIVELAGQPRKRERLSREPPPPEADVVVLGIRVVDRAFNRHRIMLTVHGKSRAEHHDASSPNDIAGVLEALVYVLACYADSVVAVAADIIPEPYYFGSIEPRNVGVRRAAAAVLRAWVWTKSGDEWLLGRPFAGG